MKIFSGLYTYCIIEMNQEADPGVKLPKDAFLVRYRNIAAIVSSVPKSNWQPTKNNIRRHQKIISQIQESFELLPLRFGIVFKDNSEIQKMLQEKYQEITILFHKIHDRVELGLRVFWNHTAFLNEVANRKVEKLKKEYDSGKKDRYLIALEVGKIVEAAVLQKREEYIKTIFEPLSNLAEDSLLSPVAGEKMVFNAAFLIKKELITNFDEAVKKISDKYKDKFTFKYSGPWPPYSFVTVSL